MKDAASPGRDSSTQPEKRVRHHSPTVTARRVGGGYELTPTHDAAAASAGKLLQGLEGPLSEQDRLIIRHILKAAEARAITECQLGRADSSHISLARLLQAYEAVLPQYGLLAQEDTHYYRILLKLTLDPGNDWWQRFYRERKQWSRRHAAAAAAAKASSSRCSPKGHAAQAAKWHSATSSKARSRKAPAARPRTAAGSAPAAVHAAAVAVDAATAAVAAAWADARVKCCSRTSLAKAPMQAAAAAAVAGAAAARSAQPPLQPAGVCLEPWQGATAEPSMCCTWLAGHDDARLSDAAAAAVNSAADAHAAAVQHTCSSPAAQQASGSPCCVHSVQHNASSSYCLSPVAARPRAASAASLRSSCCGGAVLPGASQPNSPEAAARQRSRSASPCSGLRRSGSPYGGATAAGPGLRGSSSSSSVVIHEHSCQRDSCCGSSGACTCTACDGVARVHRVSSVAAHARTCSPAAGADALSHAVLEAGQRDRLWKCLELHTPVAAKMALTQLQHQQGAARAAAASKAQLQEEVSDSVLEAQQLERYSSFAAFMAVQHNWKARALAARISRDPLAAAEQLWALALSFWEVHAAWRCLRWWQQLAAAAAEASNQHRRMWLLLCSFQWWHRMAKHYHRQQLTSVNQPLQELQHAEQAVSRPGSPLTGLARLLQQHPSVRPPCSPAAEMRQQTCGRVLATYAFAAWLGLAQQKAQQKQLQEQLTWHHVQHVQAGVWSMWRAAFEQRNPQHKLLRAVYRARRHSTLHKALRRWRAWAPVKHARRRRVRDAAVALNSSKRKRLWDCWRGYTAKRQVKNAAKRHAWQHFRRACLGKCLGHWLHALDIAAAFEELSEACWGKVLERRCTAMLGWWRQWVQYKQHQHELLESSCCHMEAFSLHRCLAAWQGCVLRRQQLQELLQQGLLMSERLAAKAAFRGWHERLQRHKRHSSITAKVQASCRLRRVTAAWLRWLEYVARRQQQQLDLQELTQRNQQHTWRKHFEAWQGLLRQKFNLLQAIGVLQSNAAQRCVQHWKAWVDNKADWRAFEARAAAHMTRVRLVAVLQQWHRIACRQALLRQLLAGFLQRHQLRMQQQAFGGWRSYLMARLAKRMNELSALLQWEQVMTRRALRVWLGRTAAWRFKHQQRLRADSYRALRLLDLALTSWSSLWTEAQEFAQKAAFFQAGRQAELKLEVLRAWGPEAARLRLKRERLEIARLHCVVTRQKTVLAAWHAHTDKRLRLRQLMGSAVQRWSQLAVSRAFEQWKGWALHQASLHRRMRAVMSMMLGRTLQWAFCMMREHALRKRRSRSARHHWRRHVAAAALQAWHQLAADAATFRAVLLDVGGRMRTGLLSEAFCGWRDVVRAKQWKEANMMRALMLWGGNRKHLCFQTWWQWVQLKQSKKASLRQALRHWQHSYLARALGFWQYYTQRKQVARQVLQHFRLRYLSAALAAWHSWYQRKSYLAAVFAQLQGKGHQQIMRVVWQAWRSFVPQAQVKRHVKGKAVAHWQSRALALCFVAWHEYSAAISAQRQQLAEALLRWDTRRLWLAFAGWLSVSHRKRQKQTKLAQGRSKRRLLVLATAFRGWREETQLQQYRRHVVVVLSHKVNNGLLLKAFNCWRDVVEARQARQQQLATALTMWWLRTQRAAFDTWRENATEAILMREATEFWAHSRLSQCFAAWRERALVQQQYNIITRVVTNKRVNRLLLDAWTAWREVVDQRRQVACRLRAVAQGWDFDQLWVSLDTWRQWARLRRLKRLAAQHWHTRRKASCLSAWRRWAQYHQATTAKLATFLTANARKQASAILQEWAALAWLLPREERAAALAASWLQRRGLLGWRQYLQQRRKWQQLEDGLAARWTNLHMAAAWQAWRSWVQGRRAKKRMADTVARRWNNLHLAAAFQAWVELVQVAHRHKAAVQTIAGRWRNLHTAAAFGAWRSFVSQRKQHRAASATVAARWQNLHLATAFLSWQQAVVEAAERVAAADAFAARLTAATVAVAFSEWRRLSARKARLRQQESAVTGRRQRLYLELAYGGWKECVQWRASKRAADAHWRQVVQRSLLALWLQRTRREAGYQRTVAVVRSRTHQQLLRRSMSSWQQFVKHQQQKATADAYAASKLQQQVFLAWAEEAGQARSKAHAAVNMGARVQARVYNQLLFQCFAAWRSSAAKGAAVKSVALRCSTRRLRTYLLAWQQRARMMAGSATLLRRLLAVTLAGAFKEWRAVAQERAHWNRVQQHLVNYLQTDDSGTASRGIRAVLHWQHPLLAAAWQTWQDATHLQASERVNELRAAKFLELALSLKALTGFKWAVQQGHVDRAAAHHRGGAVRRAVFRGWRKVTAYLQEKRQKQVAASYAWATKTKHKALTALLAYAQFRRTRSQQMLAARHHWAMRRKSTVLHAWRGVARYLGPVRRALETMTSRRHHRSRRQLFAGWRLVCHRSALLRMALGRRMRRTLAGAFQAWRGITQLKQHHRSLLLVAVSRLGHLLQARAFTRWVEAARELKTLRAKAQQVLRNTLVRRMRAAMAVWQGYVEYRAAKRGMEAVANRHWRRLYGRHSLAAWGVFVKEARKHAALSEQMLMRRQQKQRSHMLHWWHLVAQDLHHHRVVLESFRARRLREEGIAVFAFWRDWAHWRALERRAIVAHWHKLMHLAFDTWKQHHEDLLVEKAVSHDAKRHTAHALMAWKLGLALINRKRVLLGAAVQLHRKVLMQHGMWGWERFTYYKHMGHVALHFRVRRLACVVLREWQEAAAVRVEERATAEALTHELAVACATRVLTAWQQTWRAATHWRQHTLRGCIKFWAYWAPGHRARNAGWRAAAADLAARKLARCFYCWRWHCQVRVLREVAFQHKQRAIREALAIGEQVARRRRAALLASSFMAWHVQVSRYRQVAQKLAGLLQRSISSCFRAWREATDEARVKLLRAQRQHTVTTLSRLLPAWQDAAAEAREQREAAEAAADKLQRRRLLGTACRGWAEEIQVVQEQRQGLWQLMLMLLGHERRQLLQAAAAAWREWVQRRVLLRARVAAFVNTRRLECLGEFFTLWQQYAAAMRGKELDAVAAASAAAMLQHVLSPAAQTPRHQASTAQLDSAQAPSGHLPPSSPCRPLVYSPESIPQAAAAAVAAHGSPRRGADGAAGAPAVRPPSPPGLLPVTGGPGSPLLGPRSAQQDRRMARRMLAMAGGAAEVDAGSDDEQQLLQGLPITQAALSAAERAARQQPLLALSKGYRQRRVTHGDDRRQYDDAAEAAAAGVPSPHWDLHSAAESMQQAHMGVAPWELPSVHMSPTPKPPHPDSLTLEQLRTYEQLYPYSLQQQWQQQQEAHTQQQLAQQQLLRVSQQQPIGRPGSAGVAGGYQPLLQQQLDLQGQLRQQQQEQPLPWRQGTQHKGCQQQRHSVSPPVAAEPWHSGQPRWQTAAAAVAAAGIHWPGKVAGGGRAGRDDNGSSTGVGSSRSSSPSSASALAGSVTALHVQQVHPLAIGLRGSQRWADKATASPPQSPAAAAAAAATGRARATSEPTAAAGRQSSPPRHSAPPRMQQPLPSFNGQVLPHELAVLLKPTDTSRHTF